MQEQELINHPQHYTSHKSGIECIDFIDSMNFPLGSASKYLWRRDYKDKLIQDIDKAIWYMEYELEKRKKYIFRDFDFPNPMKILTFFKRKKMVTRIKQTEDDPYIATAFSCLNKADFYFLNISYLENALECVLIFKEKNRK